MMAPVKDWVKKGLVIARIGLTFKSLFCFTDPLFRFHPFHISDLWYTRNNSSIHKLYRIHTKIILPQEHVY